jgi:hypothetical protein
MLPVCVSTLFVSAPSLCDHLFCVTTCLREHRWVGHSGLGLAERSSTANTVAPTTGMYFIPGYTILTGMVLAAMSCPAMIAANALTWAARSNKKL